MKFPVFASVILFCVLLMTLIKIQSKRDKKTNAKYWAREEEANNIRKQSLDSLDYVHIPEEFLHYFDNNTDETISETILTLKRLQSETIVNFSGITNTDLKMSYGTANLEMLSQYDANYTLLARTLQTLAEYLYNSKRVQEAQTILEFLLQSHCDMISTYRMLFTIYSEKNDSPKIDYLISVATTLPGLTRAPILKFLQENRPSDSTDEESILGILD